ncbi:hypothetical protein FPZ54_04630 [Sphingomonas suaedae]|uniref:Uncharacterized protein n=1 Tax=Sphingomonas suaedae TaxID=2599297 RepID=A0A518RD31_9SPHN|nr:hypothetical protein [Sphingomonas suaedae]QDX25378.1 hypothetical protein FPZ54_04630 [Sphingomonas suaedae]
MRYTLTLKSSPRFHRLPLCLPFLCPRCVSLQLHVHLFLFRTRALARLLLMGDFPCSRDSLRLLAGFKRTPLSLPRTTAFLRGGNTCRTNKSGEQYRTG